MTFAIETEALSKYYGSVHAVEGLSLRVKEGELYAFLGLNGAGKTTTIRMLLGMIHPTCGSATVLQRPVHLGSRHPWERVGYLVEQPHAYPELTVLENLEVTRRLHPGTPSSAVGQICTQLSLSEYANRPAGTLSQGNAQRLGLAKALMHSPRLVFLDEPANGLDPAGIVEIRELLHDLTTRQGVTVFMSSHILAEVARLAQRIGIIHQGHLIQELSLPELEQNRHRRLLLCTLDYEAARQALASANLTCQSLPDGTLALSDAFSVAHPEEVNRLLVSAGASPSYLAVEEEELEPYFLRLVGTPQGGTHV